MSTGLHVVRTGTGPRILLIHGSAADHTTWGIQLASGLKERFTLIAYDRRVAPSVEVYADDALGVLADDPAKALVVGSSFGAVIALDLIRRHPDAIAGAVLIEPPMAANDDAPTESLAFLDAFDAKLAAEGGPAAAELFLRTVLGDLAYERMPNRFKERAKAMSAEIRADSRALIGYRPRYAELGEVAVPVQLLGGDRSAAYFRPTLDALLAALGDARLEIFAGAGHMLHAEAVRKFGEVVAAFAGDVGRV